VLVVAELSIKSPGNILVSSLIIKWYLRNCNWKKYDYEYEYWI